MREHIDLNFTGLGITLRARLLWDDNPALCELLCDNLPIETIYSHTMASGQGMYAPTRIVGHAAGAKHVLLTKVPLMRAAMPPGAWSTPSMS